MMAVFNISAREVINHKFVLYQILIALPDIYIATEALNMTVLPIRHGKHVKIHAEISIFDFTLEPDKNTLSGHEHHSLILSVTLIFLSLHPECNSTIYRIQLWVNISRLQNSRWSICARWSQILHKEYIWNFICYSAYSLSMMTSWNGNIYVVIGPCSPVTGEFHVKSSDAELWCFLWSATKWTVE